MRWKFPYVALVLSLVVASCARRGPESSVSFKPARPVVGDSIVVTYVPGTESPLAEADSVFLHYQIYSALESGLPKGFEIPMQKRGSKWVAGFRLTDEDAGCVLFQFTSDGLRDSNKKIAWHILVHDEDGKPTRGAYYALAQTFLSPLLIERERDLDKAAEYAQKEVESHPDHLEARLLHISLKAREAAQDSTLRIRLVNELDSLLATRPDDQDLLAQAYGLYGRLGQAEKRDSLLEALRKLNPQHALFLSMEWEEIRNLPDLQQRVTRGLEFYRKVRDPEFREMLRSWLVDVLTEAKEWPRLVAFVDTLKDPDPALLNSAAWKLVENNRMLTQAAEIAKRAIELYRAADISRKPAYLPERRWRESERSSLGYTLDTYAFALYKMGKLQDAEAAFREAYQLTEGTNADITQRYVQCLIDLGEKDKALQVAREAVSRGRTNEALNNLLLSLSRELTGETAEAESLISAWKQKMAEKRQERLKEKFLETPIEAPSFRLASLDGDTVALEDLKGKIVIVDFWATWCGPCKASFPYLQKFWEKHRNDPDLALFAINCWERKPEQELIPHVREFIQSNQYTFPVLLDAKDRVVSAFKVTGIPTKFFIGPDGKIYVKDVGFGGPDMLEEMEEILNMLRARFTAA